MRVPGPPEQGLAFMAGRGPIQAALGALEDPAPLLEAMQALVLEHHDGSGTELQAAAGTVRGSFEFVSLEGDERFEAEVPPFALVAPPSESSV